MTEAEYRRIARELAEAISSGELLPGSALPTLDELAAAEGVSKSTIQRALSILDDRGLIRSQHGKAIFVCDRPLP
jgi:DNA-binding GntR family transcriptional regulator